MKTSIARSVAVSGLSLLILTGCTSKRQELKIKKLETELEALQQDLNDTVDSKEKESAELQEAKSKLESETADQINTLTRDRDRLAAETENLKRQIERVEAERKALIPKDASTPGHADFDPSKETKYTAALATITGDVTKGSGFVVETEGKHYLYTPPGNLAGNSRLTITNAAGDKLTKFGNLETVEGCPFVRLELLEADAVPALQLATENAQVSGETKVSCLGLTANTGMVTGALGNAYGQSKDTIDLEPGLLVGRVGGPVIDATSGKLLGMIINPAASHADLWEDTTTGEQPQPRVSRLNRALVWEPVPVAAFLAEAKKITDFDRLTRVSQALAVLVPGLNGLGAEVAVSGSRTALSILTEAKDFSPAVEAATLHEQLVTKKVRVNGTELKKRISSLYASAAGQLTRNADAFVQTKFSPYHRKAAEDSARWRKEADVRLTATANTASTADFTPPPEPSKRDRNKVPGR